LQTWATATGAPIIADTAKPAPAAAKSEVMGRDLVGRIGRLFSTVEKRHFARAFYQLVTG
jgi:hypothetical protein